MTRLNHKNSRSSLNVHAIMPVSYVNGPGARAVVWTQGCNQRCPGCSNPLTHSHTPKILIDPEELSRYILAIPGIEGLTVSGGEPFEQALAVSRLCNIVKKGGLSVMVFTGWIYKNICQCHDPEVRNLLQQIDILVDGPFIQNLADKSLLWRGSRNQQIRLLTNRYGPDILQNNSQSQVEGQLQSKASLQITGFPGEADLAVLAQHLSAEFGIFLEPSSENWWFEFERKQPLVTK